MVRMNRTPAFLLNFAHALDHLFLLIFATAVAAIAADFEVVAAKACCNHGLYLFRCHGVSLLSKLSL